MTVTIIKTDYNARDISARNTLFIFPDDSEFLPEYINSEGVIFVLASKEFVEEFVKLQEQLQEQLSSPPPGQPPPQPPSNPVRIPIPASELITLKKEYDIADILLLRKEGLV